MLSSPDPDRLRELCAQIGLTRQPAESTPSQPAGARIRFAAPPPPRAAPSAASEARPESDEDIAFREHPDAREEPEPAPLPPIAEMSDEALERSVFGDSVHDLGVEQRLDQFVRWVMGSTGAFGAFVADGEGLVLANHHAPESFVAATAPLGSAQEAISAFVPSPIEGSTTVELHDHNVLQIVWVRSGAERLAVGLILAAPLDPQTVTRVRRLAHLSVSSKGAAS